MMKRLSRNALVLVVLAVGACRMDGLEPAGDGATRSDDLEPAVDCPPVGTEDPAPKFGGPEYLDRLEPGKVGAWGVQVRYDPPWMCTLSNEEITTLPLEERLTLLRSRSERCRACPLQAAIDLGARIPYLSPSSPMFIIEAPGRVVLEFAARTDVERLTSADGPIIPE